MLEDFLRFQIRAELASPTDFATCGTPPGSDFRRAARGRIAARCRVPQPLVGPSGSDGGCFRIIDKTAADMQPFFDETRIDVL